MVMFAKNPKPDVQLKYLTPPELKRKKTKLLTRQLSNQIRSFASTGLPYTKLSEIMMSLQK